MDHEFLNDKRQRRFFRKTLDCFRYIEKWDMERTRDFADSFCTNQCMSKQHLIDCLNKTESLNKKQTAGIIGSWYGSILYPSLVANKIIKIIGWDMDLWSKKLSDHLFVEYWDHVHIENIVQDVWVEKPKFIDECDVIINTSCEHMPPMKYWDHFNYDSIYAFQSNNMFDVKDHINCVSSLEEFLDQMPGMMNIMHADEMEIESLDDGSKRFTIIASF